MNKVKIIFVGTGNFANMGKKANQAIWISAGDKNILLDCGPTTLYQLRKLHLNPNDLDGVFFTHFHGDHFAGIVFLDLALALEYSRTRKIIYAGPEGVKERFSVLSECCYHSFYPNFSFERKFQVYQPQHTYYFHDFCIFPIKMQHAPESIGYRVQIAGIQIAVTGDTGWSESVSALSQGTDLLITECTNYKKANKGKHLSYEELLEHQQELEASRILLIHPGQDLLKHSDEIGFEIAEDGMEISF